MCFTHINIILFCSFNKFVNTLNDLRQLHEFVGITLDRRQDPGGIQDDQKPPFTYEAYAEALTNVCIISFLYFDFTNYKKILCQIFFNTILISRIYFLANQFQLQLFQLPFPHRNLHQ